MAASLAVCLSEAWRDAAVLTVGVKGDPLRLELPPEQTSEDSLAPRTAAVLGSLYLVSELDQVGVMAGAELLAAERWNLGLRDPAAVAALEAFAADARDRPDAGMRAQLFARLFGVVPAAPSGRQPSVSNDVFEELLAAYCQAITAYRELRMPRAASDLRLAGKRLQANLGPRQYGNTLIVATALVEQVRACLDLLSMAGIGQLFGTTGAWAVLRSLHPAGAVDIGRRVDRGRCGQVVVASVGYPPVPELVDAGLGGAAEGWLVATGFDAQLAMHR